MPFETTDPRPTKCPKCGRKDVKPTWSRGLAESAFWRCQDRNCAYTWYAPYKGEKKEE